jgi:hypothetical protein
MPIYVKNFGNYSVKNVKSFMGREGYGFNCNLYKGKKMVAFCYDDASGGPVDIDWLPKEYPQVEDKTAWAAYREKCQAEKAELQSHLDTLPEVDWENDGFSLKIDMGWFITDLVSKWERERDERKMKKRCQTKTLFRTAEQQEGQHWEINRPIDDRVRNHINKKYGDQLVEIINDRFYKF